MCDKLMYTVEPPLDDHLRDRTKWQLEKGGHYRRYGCKNTPVLWGERFCTTFTVKKYFLWHINT